MNELFLTPARFGIIRGSEIQEPKFEGRFYELKPEFVDRGRANLMDLLFHPNEIKIHKMFNKTPSPEQKINKKFYTPTNSCYQGRKNRKFYKLKKPAKKRSKALILQKLIDIKAKKLSKSDSNQTRIRAEIGDQAKLAIQNSKIESETTNRKNTNLQNPRAENNHTQIRKSICLPNSKTKKKSDIMPRPKHGQSEPIVEDGSCDSNKTSIFFESRPLGKTKNLNKEKPHSKKDIRNFFNFTKMVNGHDKLGQKLEARKEMQSFGSGSQIDEQTNENRKKFRIEDYFGAQRGS